MESRARNRRPFATTHRSSLPLAALLALAVLAPATVSAEARKAASPAGDLLLTRADGITRVRQADGAQAVVPLGPAARIGDFRSLGAGWLVTAVRDGREIVILQGDGTQVETLIAPEVGRAAQVREPLLLIDGNGLGGLIWLEGDGATKMAVRAARRARAGWDDPVTVSPAGRGTQIALTAAALAEGSFLAAWAAFDGNDDEIVWSRYAEGAWTRPQAVADNNQVPDVMPHLRAAGGSALLAWSRYDGNDYRLNVARFDGGAWSRPEVVGPRGSVDGTWSDGDRPLLVYLKALPRSWAVLELDDAGKVRRAAELESAHVERPVVRTVSDEGVVLEWAGVTGSTTVRWGNPP